MGFDVTKFGATKFKDRTADVPVPELQKFFGEGEKAIWTVKGLTAEEIAIANDAKKVNDNIESVITGLSSRLPAEKAEAVKDLIGVVTDKVPADVVWRISMLVSGSVNPKCDQQMAVKLGSSKGMVFYRLTNKILELTGRGKLGE